MSTLVALRRVYEGSVFYDTAAETFMAYSFGWQFTGDKYYLELCRDSVAEIRLGGLPGRVSYTVYSRRGAGCWEKRLGVLERLALPARDLSGYYERASRDPLLECIPARHAKLTLRLTPGVWPALVVAVCQQNASFAQGWRMVYRLHKLYGRRYLVGGHVYTSIPGPREVDAERLRHAGLGYRAEALARAAGILARESLDEAGPAEVEEALFRVKGIGPYTLGLTLLLSKAKLDAHIVDRWIAALASRAYRVPDREAHGEWARRWGRWRGIASYHLTITLDAEPLRRAIRRLEEGDKCPRRDPDKPTPLAMWRFMS